MTSTQSNKIRMALWLRNGLGLLPSWSISQEFWCLQMACQHTDLSPCPDGDGGEGWIRHPIRWPETVDDAKRDHLPPLVEPGSNPV